MHTVIHTAVVQHHGLTLYKQGCTCAQSEVRSSNYPVYTLQAAWRLPSPSLSQQPAVSRTLLPLPLESELGGNSPELLMHGVCVTSLCDSILLSRPASAGWMHGIRGSIASGHPAIVLHLYNCTTCLL